jgi:D-alanine-D-alanine ligase
MKTTRRLKVAVLFGGRSAEHEVSVLSARNVIAALDPDRFEPIPIGIARDGRWCLQSTQRLLHDAGSPHMAQIDTASEGVTLVGHSGVRAPVEAVAARRMITIDVAVPLVHGPMGEDGTLQGLLEQADIPYVGAGVLGSAVGMDKDVMKRLLRDAGLPIPRFRVVRRYEYDRSRAAALSGVEALSYPLFVKPANLGSSVGVTRVLSCGQLPAALATAFAFDTKAIVEASVPGELLVRHPDGFYSYDAKYVDEGVGLRIPADLAAAQIATVQALAIEVFKVLECSGLARVDFFLRPDGAWLVNEINTLPGFTAISMYPKLWAASGIAPRELVTRLIELAVQRHSQRRALRRVPTMRSASPARAVR